MADNTTVNAMSGGDVIATDDVGGVKYQRVKTTYGSDGTATDVDASHGLPVVLTAADGTAAGAVTSGDSGQNAQVTAGSRKEVSFSTTTAQAVASTDVSNYRWVSVQVVNVGTGTTFTFQGSNDNTNWVSVPMLSSTTTSLIQLSTTAAGLFSGPCNYRYFRINVTGITAGTASGVVEFFANPGFNLLSTLSVGNTPTVDTELPAAAALADATANPTVPLAGAPGLVYNGTTWDRARGANSAANANGTGLLGAGLLAYDASASLFRRVQSDINGYVYVNIAGTPLVTLTGNSPVQLTPTAGQGGWNYSAVNTWTSARANIKASAGLLGGYMIYNPNTSVIYIQVFDLALGSITLGTTAPTYVLGIPAGSAANVEFTAGISHSTAIYAYATTTATGSTAPGTALSALFLYR